MSNWQSNATFSGNYNYGADANAAPNSSGQSRTKHFALLALFGLLAACYFLFGNNTTAARSLPVKKEIAGIDTVTQKPAKKKVEVPTKVEKKTTQAQALIESPAPAKPSELTEEDVKAFIKKWAWLAKEEMKRTGIPASISLAQAIIESRCGTSKLATMNNNYFGIKCFSRNCKDGHCSNRKDDHHKDFFRKFTKKRDSWTAHSNFLCQKRYKPLHGRGWRGWCYGLQEKGYATSKTYGKDLEAIVNRYKLYEYDRP